jgi:hypothetical protein
LIHFCLLDQIELRFYLLAAKPFTAIPWASKWIFFLQVANMSGGLFSVTPFQQNSAQWQILLIEPIIQITFSLK